MSADLSGDIKLPCRQPKSHTVQQKSLASLYRARTDSRWQRLVTAYNPNTNELVLSKIKDVSLGQFFEGELLCLSLRVGKDLICASNTLVLTKDGRKVKVQDVKISDSIGCARNTRIWFSAVEKVTEAVYKPGNPLYSVELEDSTLGLICNTIIVLGAEEQVFD
jgi:hypothetical protein